MCCVQEAQSLKDNLSFLSPLWIFPNKKKMHIGNLIILLPNITEKLDRQYASAIKLFLNVLVLLLITKGFRGLAP